MSYGINTFIILFLTPFVIKKVGMSGFGVWRAAIAFVGYYGILNVAVSSSITRYVARFVGQNDRDSLNETVGTAMSICLVTATVVILTSFLFADIIVTFFDKTPPELINQFRWLIRIVGFATGIGFFASLLGAIVTAHEQYVVASIAGIAVNILRAVLTVIFLLNGMGLVGVGFAMLIVAVVGLIVNYVMCSWLATGLRFHLPTPVGSHCEDFSLYDDYDGYRTG